MPWGPDPAVEAAAAAAQAEIDARMLRAEERHANAKMSPFERNLLGVLEDIRDALQNPSPGPLLVTVDPAASDDLCDRIRAKLPEGSMLTGPNYPILDVRPLAGVPVVNNVVELAAGPVADPMGYFAPLLDAPPEVLGEVLDGAAESLLENFVSIGEQALARRIAEAAIEAALIVAAAFETSVVPPTTTDGAAGGDVPPIPPADTPTSP